MSTRRRTRVSAVGENSDDAFREAPPKTPATRTSSRKTKTAEADPVLPAAASSSRRVSSSGPDSLLPSDPSWSSRVTRSRSRSILRDTEPEDVTRRVTVSRVPRLPRLDIQSEDEEELEIGHNNITEDERDKPESEQSLISTPTISWPTITFSKEARGVLLASLLLLLILLAMSKVAETHHHDKNMNEAVILALAYALAPVRLTVEGVRLVGGAVMGGAQVTQRAAHAQIDYDLLVDNILASDKFHSVIDKVSSEKMSLWGLEMEKKSSKDQDQITTINSRIEDTKIFIQKELDNAISNIKTDNSNKIQYENSQREVLRVLDTQISEFKQQIEELKSNIHKSGDEKNDVLRENLSRMREELKILEDGQRVTSAEIQKCCSDKSDINLVIENKVSGLVEQLKQDLPDKFVTEEELKLRLMQVESENKKSFVELTSEIVEETKSELEQLVNTKVEDLKRDLSHDMAHYVETDSNNTKGSSGVDSVDVKKIVREALTKYDADKTGLFDFALETAGGSVVTTKCTEPYQMTSAVMSVWGIPFWWETNTPRTILQPGTSPGQCWAFRGSHGVIVVQLSASIHITAVTIEHISSLLSPDGTIYSAPASMSLAGVTEEAPDSVTPLLNFTYSAHGDPVQTFRLPGEGTGDRWRVVELSVHNNHGHPDYTCLYRFRVHGTVSQEGGSEL